MKLTTVTIPAVELTREEEHIMFLDEARWKSLYNIDHWNHDDGRNEILFLGENFYRVVTRPKMEVA